MLLVVTSLLNLLFCFPFNFSPDVLKPQTSGKTKLHNLTLLSYFSKCLSIPAFKKLQNKLNHQPK